MQDVAWWFASGGSFMYAVLTAGCACTTLWVPVLVMALLLRKGSGRRAAQAVTLLYAAGTLLPLALGAMGWQIGLANVEQALAYVDPDQAAELEAYGRAEASVPLRFGSVTTILLAFGALVPVLLALRPAADAEEAPNG